MTIKNLGITEIGKYQCQNRYLMPLHIHTYQETRYFKWKGTADETKKCADPAIKKDISFGVNDTKEKRELDKEKFRIGKYMELQSVTFQYESLEIVFGGICLKIISVKISFDSYSKKQNSNRPCIQYQSGISQSVSDRRRSFNWWFNLGTGTEKFHDRSEELGDIQYGPCCPSECSNLQYHRNCSCE